MKRLAEPLTITAVAAHALGALASGSLNPADWGALLLLTIVLIVAPLVGLGVAVISGALR
jgi:hypothetical protein